jgi:hypothetical protein
VDKFIMLCANLLRKNCSDDVFELITYAREFEKQAAWRKSDLYAKDVEIAQLKAENEFLRRTLEESDNTD